MYAAASKRGGAGGVPQAVGEEFVAADKPGKLPKRKAPKPSKRKSPAIGKGAQQGLINRG